MWNRYLLVGGGTLLMACLRPAPLAAQSPGDSLVLYEREVFRYDRAGRPDPFRSLLDSPELGMRFEDLSLLGVIHHPEPSRSVAVLSQVGSDRRIRVRVGDRLGGIRVLSIGPRSVDVVVEEFGIARRETLELRSASEKGSSR